MHIPKKEKSASTRKKKKRDIHIKKAVNVEHKNDRNSFFIYPCFNLDNLRNDSGSQKERGRKLVKL